MMESDQTGKATSELNAKKPSPPVNSEVESSKEISMFPLAVALILLVLLPVVCIDLIKHAVDRTELQRMGIYRK